VSSTPKKKTVSKPDTCVVEVPKHGTCRKPAEWRGLCAAHRATRRGDALPKEARGG
jgi:hypothetical protein